MVLTQRNEIKEKDKGYDKNSVCYYWENSDRSYQTNVLPIVVVSWIQILNDLYYHTIVIQQQWMHRMTVSIKQMAGFINTKQCEYFD